MKHRLEQARFRQTALCLRLARLQPELSGTRQLVAQFGHELQRAAQTSLRQRRERLETLASHLQHLCPESVLARGYAIARDSRGRVLRSVGEASAGMAVDVQLADGTLHTRVTGTGPDEVGQKD